MNNEDQEIKSEDRDQIILHIMDNDRKAIKHANSHLGDLSVKNRTITYWSERNNKRNRDATYWSDFKLPILNSDKVSLVMAPAWGVIFPPYNIARLTGLLRHFGYTVHVHDINVEAYKSLTSEYNVDYWESQNYYKWENPVYENEVHELIKPLLDSYVNRILSEGSNFIGFSLYLTNLLPSLYMIRRIKEIDPSKVIIVGGPEAFNTWFEDLVHQTHGFPLGFIDYRVKGEGEQELLTLLENHNTIPKSDGMITLGGMKSSLDLNRLPFPDYSDYNLNDYQHSDGVSIETSRGCVAKCTFCAETHFWRYRWRESTRVIDEISYQIEQYGVNRFWFVDSLVNGNIKEFRNLVKEIIDKKIDIRWNSYARCDGRMDAAFFKDIASSGCVSLSFGVESGSEKVLKDMKKLIKVWEIEDNLRDADAAGIKSHVNWVVGFPSEDVHSWLHSLHVLHNCRNWIYAISPGMTCGDAAFSEMNTNWERFDLQWNKVPWDNTFMSNWFTSNYKNTILHRFVRLKFMNIWLYMMQKYANAVLINGQNRKDITEFFKFSPKQSFTVNEYIPQRTGQNFEVFNSGASSIDKLSNGLANEYMIMPWIIYQAYGPFEFELKHDPAIDLPEFGGFITSPYYADFKCSVDEQGNMKFNLVHKFEHRTTRDDTRVEYHEILRENMSFDWREYNYECHISEFDGTIYDSKNTENKL